MQSTGAKQQLRVDQSVLNTTLSVAEILSRLAFDFEHGLLSRVIYNESVEGQHPNGFQGGPGQDSQVLQECRTWIQGYQKGLTAPFNLNLFAPINISLFRQKVWDEVSQIPFGEVRTYSDIARSIGSPRAVRAVGTAIGQNPCFIVRPCHRVISSQGTLGGFALNPEIKRVLLAHEGTFLDR